MELKHRTGQIGEEWDDVEPIYKIGMAERAEKNRNINPGQGTYHEKKFVKDEKPVLKGPKDTMGLKLT